MIFNTLLLLQLAFLPDTKREYVIDDDIESLDSELSSDESSQFEKRNKKPGMLGWFKTKVHHVMIICILASH